MILRDCALVDVVSALPGEPYRKHWVTINIDLLSGWCIQCKCRRRNTCHAHQAEGGLSQDFSDLACRFTEADLRMYPTIIRYDGCYTTLFKCCRKRIGDYPHLSAWLADVHQLTVTDSPNLQVAPPILC